MDHSNTLLLPLLLLLVLLPPINPSPYPNPTQLAQKDQEGSFFHQHQAQEISNLKYQLQIKEDEAAYLRQKNFDLQTQLDNQSLIEVRGG